MRLIFICLVALSLTSASAAWLPREGREMLGRPAPEFAGLTWLTSPSLSVKQLRGKVVLIRFWLTGCPLCRATAPALNELHRAYAAKGLVVIGIHTPKSPEGHAADYVRQGARGLGFRFPIAMDNGWATLRRYWLNGPDRSYTSVTFLVDRRGIIRWLHDGGEFFAGGGPGHEVQNAAYASLRDKVHELLAEGDG